MLKHLAQRLVVLSCLVAVQTAPKIMQIDEIEDILPYITKGHHVLATFDIDNTLVLPEDEAARDEWFTQQLQIHLSRGEKQQDAIAKILQEQITAHRTTKVHPVDKDNELVFSTLRQKGVHTIAITARGLDFIPITYRELTDIKIDLAHMNDDPDWKQCYEIRGFETPAYYAPGILFCSGNEKGKVLEKFLKQLKYLPDTLILTDDTLKNIKSVERMANRLGIHCFYGFHFIKVEKLVKMGEIPAVGAPEPHRQAAH